MKKLAGISLILVIVFVGSIVSNNIVPNGTVSIISGTDEPWPVPQD